MSVNQPQLDLDWDEDMGSKISCQLFIEKHFLKNSILPLVLAIDNLHLVFEYPQIAQNFLSMLRSWQERTNYADPWRKLRLVVLYSTEFYVPLKIHQFLNVGISLNLPPFNFAQSQALALRYGLSIDGVQLAPLLSLVGGHPYLLSIAFYHLSQQHTSLQDLVRNAPTISGVYSRHLRELWTILKQESELMLSWQKVLNSPASVELEAIAAYRLESLGLVILVGNYAKSSCELYRLFFQQQLNLLDTGEKLLKLEEVAVGRVNQIAPDIN